MKNDMNNVQSPCTRNCCLNENDICLGCFRSLSEILIWGQASSVERNAILLSAKERAKEADNRYP
jgi:predicted Fe-S protein YdhL (DUF1289 family)